MQLHAAGTTLLQLQLVRRIGLHVIPFFGRIAKFHASTLQGLGSIPIAVLMVCILLTSLSLSCTGWSVRTTHLALEQSSRATRSTAGLKVL